jgi:hypothetical protein
MKALTVWQPWATLIAWPLKPVENRTWRADWVLGKRIAIHAGNKFDDDAALHLSVRAAPVPSIVSVARKIRGAIVCTAVVDRFVVYEDLVTMPVREMAQLWDQIREWFCGPIGWVLRDVQKFAPVPCRGAQGLWEVPSEVLARFPEAAR